MRRLDGKTILLAGAGGLGNEIARRYAAEGANVVLGDIDLDRVRAVVDEIRRAGGIAIATLLDGADEASITAAVTLACKHYGGLDGLHANFASYADTGDETGVLDVLLEQFDESIRVNVRGFFLCTRQALPAIIARGGGSILYTSSAAAYYTETTRVAYAMGKAASHALMRHVAVKYGVKGIRANCIAPGIIIHERWDTVTPEIEAWVLSVGIMKRRGRPQDIAAMSALLMSDEGSFITGQIINVDGGQTRRA